MAGDVEKQNSCFLWGGQLKSRLTAISFVFEGTVIVVTDVPPECCLSCHEQYVSGKVTDELNALLTELKAPQTVVSIVSYPDRVAA